MTQNALVIAVLSDGTARVQIERISACGHDCSTCDGCGLMAAPIEAIAKNPIGAKVGDTVLIESGTNRVLKFAALTYLLPIFLLFLFYGISRLMFRSETLCSTIAIIGFLLGLFGAVSCNRSGQIETVIRSVQKSGEPICSDM